MTDPDATPTTFRDALRASEFWMLLITALSAGFGLSAAITIPACMAGLLISSLPKYAALHEPAKAAGASATFWATILASILIAAAASIAAHVLGRLTWWLWGL